MMKYKSAKLFDCHDMPGGAYSDSAYFRTEEGYCGENNLCSQFLRLGIGSSNDTIIEWVYLEDEEEVDELFEGENKAWEWKKTQGQAIKDVNKWLVENGAIKEETILIKFWW